MTGRNRILIVVVAGVAGGLFAWQRARQDSGPSAPIAHTAPAGPHDVETGGDAPSRRPPPRSAFPERTASGVDSAAVEGRPTLVRERGGPVDWQDFVRDPTWAPEMERALEDLARPRLSADFPEARWVQGTCHTRTCTIELAVPAGEAELLHEYVGGLLQVDDLVFRPRGPQLADDEALVHVDLWFPDAIRAPDRLAEEQARVDATYPHIRERQRAWLTEVRRTRSEQQP